MKHFLGIIVIICILISAAFFVSIITQKNKTATTFLTDQSQTQKVFIYLVAVDDDGKTGKKIGCGDSLIEIQKDVPKTKDALTAALTEVLSKEKKYSRPTGLYNALYNSTLTVSKIEVKGDTANIYLTGEVSLGGVCDSPRVDEQLKATVLQFPEIQEVNIFINDIPLKEALSQK